MAKQLKSQNSTFSRYRGLIQSIGLFLILVIAVLTFNIYTIYLVERNSTQVSAAQQLRGLAQNISRDLYDLKLSQSEDIRSPHIQYTISKLQTNQEKFSGILSAFTTGGQIENSVGEQASINALDVDQQASLAQIQGQWNIWNDKLTTYLKVANDINTPPLLLDQVVDATQGSSISIDNHTSEIVSALSTASLQQATYLRYLQITAISLAVLYFVVFMFYFVRRLTTSDAQANEARRETSEILDTVKTGLFLLDNDLNLGHQYSKELEQIIGHRDIGGKNFSEILNSMISGDDMETTQGFIKQLYNPKVKERLIADLNPLSRIETMVDDLSGYQRTRFLDFKFSRVYSEKEIVRVLVNVSDITDTVKLEQRLMQERENNDLQIDMLTTILNTDALLINDFISTVHKHTTAINDTLRSSGTSQSDLQKKLQQIFREAHNLKGISSSLGLYPFTNASGILEDKVKNLQKESTLSGDDFLPLAVALDELIKLTQIIDQLNKRISGQQQHGNNQTTATLESIKQTNAPRLAFTQNLQQFSQDLARRQFKQVKLTTQSLEEATTKPGLDEAIRDIAIQVLRNAVVHGIESPSVRLTRQKDQMGHIQIKLHTNDDQVQLIIEDDGQGINYDAIKERAISSGQYSEKEIATWEQRKLLGLLFTPGFSTYGQSDDDAGQGVGLDVVKDRVQKLGGKIGIHSQPGQFTRFSFTFPLHT